MSSKHKVEPARVLKEDIFFRDRAMTLPGRTVLLCPHCDTEVRVDLTSTVLSQLLAAQKAYERNR